MFIEIFKPLCKEKITIYAAATSNFEMYFNDELILKGDKMG